MGKVFQDELWYEMMELCLRHLKHSSMAKKVEAEAEFPV
jgi:hypothetical protein